MVRVGCVKLARPHELYTGSIPVTQPFRIRPAGSEWHNLGLHKPGKSFLEPQSAK